MLSVVAAMPPTSTLALGAKRTPFGLTRNSWPFAVKLPKMSERWEPTTRLSATAEALGCRKFTASLVAIEKPCQFRIAFCEA